MDQFTNETNHRGKYPVSRSVYRNLFLYMMFFGLFVGLLFPPFARIVLNTDKALSLPFFLMCVTAGLLVGLVNFLIFRLIVSRELERVRQGMSKILEAVVAAEHVGTGCEEDCILEITSADIIGDITLAFNSMTRAIARRLQLEFTSREIYTNLTISVDLEEVSETILSSLSGVIQANGGVLYGGTEGKMNLLADFGVDRANCLERISEESGPVKHVLESGKIITISPEKDGLDWIEQSTPLGSFKPRSVLMIPLKAKQRAVGLVALASNIVEPSEEQIDVLEALRSYSAPYLDNAMLHRKVTDLAAIDDLTKVLNRRFGLNRLREEFSRSVRHGLPVSVLMIDVDHFKKFNDTFGHDAGDVVLQMVAETINSQMRAGDMVCRYGGEEFMVLGTGTGMNDGAVFAERIRRAIETTEVPWEGKKLSVTISVGLATWPIISASVSEEMVTAADKALYGAKDFGRNQVAVNQGDKIVPVAMLELPETPKEKVKKTDRERK
jgi:two-component system, cell cycle response regulator